MLTLKGSGNDESGAGMVCLHDDSLMKAGTTAAVRFLI